MFPEGNPVAGSTIAQRNFEFHTMEFMALQVFRAAKAKGKDWRDFLSFYFLARYDPPSGPIAFTGKRRERVQKNGRYMIYVHSKLMIIDDEYLIVGSANLNERSLAGDRDSEICIYLRPGEGKLAECKSAIQDLRRRTWEQHLGVLPPTFEDPQQAACVSAVRDRARSAWRELRVPTATTCHLVALPFKIDAGGKSFFVEAISASPAEDPFIVDAEATAVGASVVDWFWSAPMSFNNAASHSDICE
jgi:phospholipase D1/2